MIGRENRADFQHWRDIFLHWADEKRTKIISVGVLARNASRLSAASRRVTSISVTVECVGERHGPVNGRAQLSVTAHFDTMMLAKVRKDRC